MSTHPTFHLGKNLEKDKSNNQADREEVKEGKGKQVELSPVVFGKKRTLSSMNEAKCASDALPLPKLKLTEQESAKKSSPHLNLNISAILSSEVKGNNLTKPYTKPVDMLDGNNSLVADLLNMTSGSNAQLNQSTKIESTVDCLNHTNLSMN